MSHRCQSRHHHRHFLDRNLGRLLQNMFLHSLHQIRIYPNQPL